MQETEYKRLIDSARERAFFGFMAAVQRSIQDADRSIVRGMALARTNAEQSALSALRHFLRQDGNVFLRHIDGLFRSYLERALQTMYVDLRPGMRKLSIDELTLVEDEVLSHQIEVGRLAERMREANEESIGRLNAIVAQMHGERDARERENPFRPYLLARSLYEAIRQVATDEAKTALLFEHLANALIEHLPGYYASLREIFESSGLHGKFVAQPSRSSHHQRYYGAPPAPAMPARFESQVAPVLHRVLDLVQQNATGTMPARTGSGDTPVPANAQELVRKMFTSSRLLRARPGRDSSAPPVAPLIAQLTAFQRQAAAGLAVDGQAAPAANQLFALRDKLDLATASVNERVTVDVIAMLFEFILDDRQLPDALRSRIARLQIPLMKAAMLEPELLHDDRHPARRLLNRISSAAVAPASDAHPDAALQREIDRITQRVLADYDCDATLFSECIDEFEQFLNGQLQRRDGGTATAIEAVELAEKLSVLLTNATGVLCELLLPLNADKRISDFVIHMWPHVLVHAAWHDLEAGISSQVPDSMFERCRSVLPELLWSIQDKHAAGERTALIRLLPDLVKRINRALQLIRLPDDERRQIMDVLVAIHTRVLRTASPGEDAALLGLDELRRRFERLAIHWERVSWTADAPPQVRAPLIEEVLAQRTLTMQLRLKAEGPAPAAADREFLAQAFLLGTRVEFRTPEREPVPARLVWISTHRSLYLFRVERDGSLVVHGSASLLDALSRRTLAPLEHAPVFERAVESLLYGAGKIPAA